MLSFNYRRNGVVVGAFASQSIDRWSFSKVESYQPTLKMVFIASLVGAQLKENNVENKPASLLLVSLVKTL